MSIGAGNSRSFQIGNKKDVFLFEKYDTDLTMTLMVVLKVAVRVSWNIKFWAHFESAINDSEHGLALKVIFKIMVKVNSNVQMFRSFQICYEKMWIPNSLGFGRL